MEYYRDENTPVDCDLFVLQPQPITLDGSKTLDGSWALNGLPPTSGAQSDWSQVEDIIHFDAGSWQSVYQLDKGIQASLNTATGSMVLTFVGATSITGSLTDGVAITSEYPNNTAAIINSAVVVGNDTILYELDTLSYDPADLMFVSYTPNSLTINGELKTAFKRRINTQINTTLTSIVIDTDTDNVNILNMFQSIKGRLPTPDDVVHIEVAFGVKIRSVYPNIEAFIFGDFPLGCSVTLDNYGEIKGKGGRGGIFGVSGTLFGWDSTDVIAFDALKGGDAIRAPSTGAATPIINNYGTIEAGGGGGGSVVEYTRVAGVYGGQMVIGTVYRTAFGAGGAGDAVGLAGNGSSVPYMTALLPTATVATYQGDAGTLTAGGQGNNPDDANYGDGGDRGQAGHANDFTTKDLVNRLYKYALPGAAGTAINGANVNIAIPGTIVG